MTDDKTEDKADKGPLATYLHNHLIAAAAGERLFDQAAKVWKDTDLFAPLSRLRDQVDEDKSALQALADDLNLGLPAYKKPLAWAGARLSTVDPLNPVHSTTGASAQLELESLLSAVTGKSLLWKTLCALADTDQRIPRDTVEELLRRAESQIGELENLLLDTVDRRFRHRD